MSRHPQLRTVWSLLLLALFAAPALAGSGIIYNGVDLWKTPGDGSSWQDFAEDPIPAGFFCNDSAPFAGKIVWEGVPLVTSPEGALRGADTLITRLDDAIFDKGGVAVTRIQVTALSLGSVEPIQTSCGAFKAHAALSRTQPITEMIIKQDTNGKSTGGTFEAPLELIVKLTFTPVDDAFGKPLAIERKASFLPDGEFYWSSKPFALTKPGEKVPLLDVEGFVLVDTDGNAKADTFVPGTSNFFPLGRVEVPEEEKALAPLCQIGCHSAGGGYCHCTNPVPHDEPRFEP